MEIWLRDEPDFLPGFSVYQVGIYARLLRRVHEHGWQLPDDERELASIVGLSLRQWRRRRGWEVRRLFDFPLRAS